jgi:hypothetical protein
MLGIRIIIARFFFGTYFRDIISYHIYNIMEPIVCVLLGVGLVISMIILEFL